MAAAVITKTRPTGVRGFADGNKKVRYLDITSDTGDYAAGGFTINATDFGMKVFDFVTASGGMATQGTAGASAVGVGITYAADRKSCTMWLYESAGSGSPPAQKGDEAMVANFTIRLRAEGQ